MSDNNDINLDDGDVSGIDAAPKKASGLGALMPNLLKFAAIGLGALIFIVTVAVITYNILDKRGTSQTVIPEKSPYAGARQQYNMFTAIGMIRTSTRDNPPYSVVVDMVIGYDLNDNIAATELTGRLYELRDFVRSFFRSRTAAQLENEARVKEDIIEL
jgi:flagellar FliL protein